MFYGVEILMAEHENIVRFADVMKIKCCNVLEGEVVDTKLFREAIDFVRNYADKHHHGKEEQILFERMLAKLGPVAEKLVKMGMLVEHDLGRLYMTELEAALNRYDENKNTENKLDILTNMTGYIDLIKRHAGKENAVVFSFADRSLTDEDKAYVDQKTKEFEEDKEKSEKRDYYMTWLDKL
jgi:hemerythrin HHE cation binding domain protein